MKTLKDIATEKEIFYLLENDLITLDMLFETPKEVREMSNETEVEYMGGLVVTIYAAAVPPVAEWK